MNFSEYFALCGEMSPLGKLVLASDLGIAIAYFAIPAGLMIVAGKRVKDIPYPWMFAFFAAFIVACGVTHLVHALQMPYTTFEHTVLEATVKTVCALLSVATAAALIAIMPRALRMVSPRERALELEREVAARTQENVRLLREINHRLGNQLQIMGSLVRLEKRKSSTPEERAVVERIGAVVDELARSYHEQEGRYSGVSEAQKGNDLDCLEPDRSPLGADAAARDKDMALGQAPL